MIAKKNFPNLRRDLRYISFRLRTRTAGDYT